jgi:hypothetical protein
MADYINLAKTDIVQYIVWNYIDKKIKGVIHPNTLVIHHHHLPSKHISRIISFPRTMLKDYTNKILT